MTKQKKMGRLLDEGDVINALWDLRRSLQMMDNTQRADLILQGVYLSEKKIEQLPSAQPEQRWIPVTERLPEKSGLYLTWTKFPYEEEPSWLIINYDADCESFGEWEEHYHPDTLGYLDSEFNEFENVFAWMPLPEPYREEGGQA